MERHRFDAHLTWSPGVQAMGVYVGLVDTDMAKFTDYPKSDPADVVRQVSTASSPVLSRCWPTR